jgi:UDP-N-acetylmuramoylalanine--D-glutamate ligase
LVTSEERDGVSIRYVDDGLATSALPTVAALEVFADVPVALIAGGFDRGVDYAPIAEALARRKAPTFLITMGGAGQRIGLATREIAPKLSQVDVASMGEAVRVARSLVVGGGIVLLSPGAPSFDQYRNWEERSDDFTNVVLDITRT